MNKTLFRASLVAMLGVVAFGNDFMNVNAMEEVPANAIFVPKGEDRPAVRGIVAKMRERIESGWYDADEAVELMLNYVYAKGVSLDALFPSVLEELKLKTPLDDDAKFYVEELFRNLGDLSLGTRFEDIKQDELLLIATDNSESYQAMVHNDMKDESKRQRALAAALAGSVKVFQFMMDKLGLSYDSDLFSAALVGGNSELVILCQDEKADKNWDFECFRGEGFINDNLFLQLIKQGKKIDKKVADRFLLTASAGGRLNFVKYLVEKGANVNAEDKDGKTPLIIASEHENLGLVKYLVDEGADVNAEDKDGKTPLIIASLNRDLKLVKYLVEENANVKAENKSGQTPLHYATLRGNSESVKYLVVDKGANVDAKDKFNQTPLHYASLMGDFGLVRYLFDEGANVNAKDTWDHTPLYYASEKGNFGLVAWLVEKCGAKITNNDINGAGTPKIKSYLRDKKFKQDSSKPVYEEDGELTDDSGELENSFWEDGR